MSIITSRKMEALIEQCAFPMPKLRSFHVCDIIDKQRQAWLAAYYPFLRSRPWDEPDELDTGLLPDHIEAVLLQSAVPDQLLSAFAGFPGYFKGRVVIALCSKSSPFERARLLNLGFDDVFDHTMPVEEARARTGAMERRRQLTELNPLSSLDPVLSRDLTKFVRKPMTRQEIQLLAQLSKSFQRPVSNDTLARLYADQSADRSINKLHSAIFRLRGKLNDKYTILTVPGSGYMLEYA